MSLSPASAKALVRNLTKGITLTDGARHIHVGHSQWLASQSELLAEVAEDGHAETKFIRGAYGSGKSHFLAVVQDHARQTDWVTSHIECKFDKVEIDRFETLYPALTRKLSWRTEADASSEQGSPTEVHPTLALLELWSQRQLKKVGIRQDGLKRPFDADNRVYGHFQQGLMRANFSTDVIRALVAFTRADLAGDFESKLAVAQWLAGATGEKLSIPQSYVKAPRTGVSHAGSLEIKPIGKGTAHEVMRGLLWLVRDAGFKGLVLCIDEVEELAKLGTRKRRDQALQALREWVDHAGGDGGYLNLCVYLAATPEMFEGPDYFPRYDALATRIEAVGDEINYRAPVVNLDRTPLNASEMQQMAARIAAVHEIAYGKNRLSETLEQFTERLVPELLQSKFRIAKPRLLTRIVIDQLERARQAGATFTPPAEVTGVIAQTATRLAEEQTD